MLDITEGSIQSELKPDLTAGEYSRIMNSLKSHGSSNKKSMATLSQVKQMWADGDRLVGNYKSLLDSVDETLL